MTVQYVRLTEVCARYAIDDALLRRVQEEGLIEVKHTLDDEVVLTPEQAERLRLIAVLTRDLEVNFAGVEVILHMHEDLCALRQQFDEVLRTLVSEMRRRVQG